MSAKLETQYRGETAQLEARVAIRDKLPPEHFEQERAKIFRRSWLLVGHASDLPAPGNDVVRNLPTLKTSLLIVRGRDGRVRSFHNVCTHRGHKRGGKTTDIEDTFPYERLEFLSVSARPPWNDAATPR